MIVGRERDQVGKGETEKEKKKKAQFAMTAHFAGSK